MKKLIAMALAAGLTCSGVASSAFAVELKASGMMNFVFESTQNVHNGNQFRDWSEAGNHQKHFAAVQRVRLNLDFIASENLSAHYQAQIGTFTWGGPAAGNVYTVGGGNGNETLGGALGTRAANIVTREAYLDWTVPGSAIKVRMGLQPLLLPGFAFLSPVLDNEGTALTVTAPVSENFMLTALWLRAYSDARRGTSLIASSTRSNDTLDAFHVSLEGRGTGFKVTPWVIGGLQGGNVLDVKVQNGTPYNQIWVTNGMLPVTGYAVPNAEGQFTGIFRPSNSTFWFAGVTGELTMFDPFRFALDFYYSANNTRHSYSDRSGWFVGGSAEYKTRYGTPALKAWYASGDDGNVKNGSERPLSLMGGFTPGASIYFNTFRTSTADNANRGDAGGMWGVSAQWNDARVIRNMSHSLRVTYFAGTNNTTMAPYVVAVQTASRALTGPASYMTTKDSVVEIDFDTDYMVYQNLFAKLELAYAFQNFNGRVWKNMDPRGEKARFSNAWRIALGITYRF